MPSREAFRAALFALATDLARRRGDPPPTAQALEPLASRLWDDLGGRPRTDPPPEPDEAGARRLQKDCAGAAASFGLPWLDDRLLKQLRQVCALRPFTRCRDSFLHSANRAEVDACRQRASGSHCVDCPWFDAFPDRRAHAEWLQASRPERWPPEHIDVWLPPSWWDFRRSVRLSATESIP